MADPQAALRNFKPKHKFFVGIDSDGCVFDSMELKHKECFIPQIIKYWNLQSISKYVREAAEFVNLYSKWRGANRFPVLVRTFDLLRERPEVIRRGTKIPDLTSLQAWIDSGVPQGNPALKEAVQKTNDPILRQTLEWSEAVNRVIGEMVEEVPPFPYVREVLEKLSPQADMIVVSGTPGEALKREWEENKIDHFAALIAGQEMGKKKEHLELTTKGNYEPNHVLMIGDAPGDLKAAQANGALFYPINPGHEEASWERFYQEALDKFLNGTFAGEYETRLMAEFDQLLPEKPPWQSA